MEYARWIRKISWRKWQPTQKFCLGNPMDREVWQATTTIYEVTESDTTE